MNRWLIILIFAITVPFPACAKDSTKKPVSVFHQLEGRWKGKFVGYDVTGKEIYRIKVTQTYRTVDAFTQVVTIEDRRPDGTVIRGTGKNIARRNAAGALEISCDITKSNGDRVQHKGRLIKGPLGTTQFVWYTVKAGRSETFREVVIPGKTPVYVINGMGRYGDKLILMAGRYLKVARTSE